MHQKSPTRAPVKRNEAEQYLLISLISFASTVIFTRLFLELSGYPQIGNGELHIAHVLWGGLILFVAALLPLIFVNRWAYFWGAFLSGVGIGLFIDEVGKFITQTNDYFYPPAAPIIYAFFLLTVLLYLQVRKPVSPTPRSEMYRALHEITELLDNDLDDQEKNRIKGRLDYVLQNSTDPEIIDLAEDLNLLIQKENVISPTRLNWFSSKAQFIRKWFDDHISRGRLKALLITGLSLQGVLAAIEISTLILFSVNAIRGGDVLTYITPQEIQSAQDLTWLIIRLAIEGLVGVISLVAALLFLLRKEQAAVSLAIQSLVISLIGVNILVFYLDQFSASIGAIFQLALLLGVATFRRRFLKTDMV